MVDSTDPTHLRALVAFARPDGQSHIMLALVAPEHLDAFIASTLGERHDRTPGIEPSTLALRSAWADDTGDLVAEFWSNPDIANNATYCENDILTRIFGDELGAPVRGNVIITGPADPDHRTISDTQDWVIERLVRMGVVAHEIDGTDRVTPAGLGLT